MNEHFWYVIEHEVKKLNESLQEFIKSVSSQNQPRRDRETHLDASARIVSIPVEVAEYYRSEVRDRPKQDDRESIRLGLEIAGVLIAFLLLSATIITGVIFYGQLHEAKRQTTILGNQADQAEKDALQSRRQVREQIRSAGEASQLDERAWVGVATWNHPEIKSGAKPLFQAVVANTGKTPALKSSFEITARAFPRGLKFDPIYPPPKTFRSLTVLQPGARTIIFSGGDQDGTAVVFTADDIEHLKQGLFILYVYGRIGYDDIFDHTHHTTFCGIVAPNLTDIYDCDTYNAAD